MKKVLLHCSQLLLQKKQEYGALEPIGLFSKIVSTTPENKRLYNPSPIESFLSNIVATFSQKKK